MASINPETAWEFADAIRSVLKLPTTRRRATVQSVDKDGTIWVQLPGSSNVTPIASTGANVTPGDTVLTELRGTSLHITENNTDPAVGTRQAGDIARQAAKPAVDAAKAAHEIAAEAEAVANATNQHFWDDDNGAHVTDVTQDEWTAAAAEDFSDLSDTKPYHNLLMNSLGILLRRALNNLVSISKSAIAFYDGLGNAASNIVARFGADGAQIGLADESHMELDYRSIQMFDRGNQRYFHVSDLRNRSGSASILETFVGVAGETQYKVAFEPLSISYVRVNNVDVTYTQSNKDITLDVATADGDSLAIRYTTTSSDAKALTFGYRRGNVGAGSVVLGNYAEASGSNSMAIGENTKALGNYSFAQGHYTVASGNAAIAAGYNTMASGRNALASGEEAEATGQASSAIGFRVTANGMGSHAEGVGTTANDTGAHAEGWNTTVTGNSGHAEGLATTAASRAHAEGVGSKALGTMSHASGESTIAARIAQTAIGRYNVEDTSIVSDDYGTYAFIIGNGTAGDARSNAQAIRWNGLTDVAGRTAYPLFVYATAPDEADLPVTPCFVLATSDYGLWYYDGN